MDWRRRLTLRGAGVAALAGFLKPSLLLASWNRQAFDARRLEDALAALGITNPSRGEDIILQAPDFADNGAFVPVEIASEVAKTDSIALFVDRNPYPYIAQFELSDEVLPAVALRIKIAESSPVRALVQAGERYYFAMREVRVVTGGCGGDGGAPEKPHEPASIKIRAKLAGGGAEVRTLMVHPMENGLRTDAKGQTIPAHFIQRMTAQLNGTTVLEAQFGRSVSADPLIGFTIRSARTGDRLTISWRDNRDMTQSGETTVT